MLINALTPWNDSDAWSEAGLSACSITDKASGRNVLREEGLGVADRKGLADGSDDSGVGVAVEAVAVAVAATAAAAAAAAAVPAVVVAGLGGLELSVIST